MKQVASLRYGVIFKKAFRIPAVFTAFVRDVTGVELEIEKVEEEKEFEPPIGQVAVKFDLYAEDKKNRTIVDIQHARRSDHYHRFLHYACVALMQQVKNSVNYRPNLQVLTIVVLTSGDQHQRDVSIIDMDPHDLKGRYLGEIPHKVFFLAPKYVNNETPEELREWLLAIEDSLDGEVDESLYHRAEIQQVFAAIERDGITPKERARMFQEYNREEGKRDAFKEGHEAGVQEGIKEGIKSNARKMLAKGYEVADIAEITGLSVEQIRMLQE